MLLTGWIASEENLRNEQAVRARFDRHAARLVEDVQRRLSQPWHGLRPASGLFAAAPAMRRSDFRTFAAYRKGQDELPGVRGLGYIQLVPRERATAFVQAERRDDAPAFTLRTRGSANDLYVVRFIEPLAGNENALGLDLAAEPVRRAAVEHAIESGHATVSGTVTLVQGGARRAGVLYLLPVYRPGAPVSSAVQRHAALVGLVYSPVVYEELMDGVGKAADQQVDLELFDGERPLSAALLYDMDHILAEPPAAGKGEARRFVMHRVIELEGGRRFNLRISTMPAFEATLDGGRARAIALTGVVLSTLLGLAVHWWLRRMRRAQLHAERLGAELERLTLVDQNAASALVMSDAAGAITWVNEAFVRISGVPQAQTVGMSLERILGVAPRVLRERSRTSATAEIFRGEVNGALNGGPAFWVDASVRCKRLPSGAVAGYVAVLSDVTSERRTRAELAEVQEKRKKEQAEAERNLKAAWAESDALLKTIHEHAIVSVADASGTITEVNEAFCAISGYSREELIGGNHRIIKSGIQTAEFWDEFWFTIASGQRWRGEICNRAKDGRLYWVDAIVAPFVDAEGRVEKFVSIRTDITARRQAVERQAQLAALVASSNEAIISLTPQGVVTSWNRGAEGMFGYSAEQMLGRSLDTIAALPLDHNESVERIANGERELYLETLRRRADGTMVETAETVSAICDDAGTLIGISTIARDITTQRMHEAELMRAKAAADDANQAKSQFLANMSHEIRTPLNAMLGMLTLLHRTELNARQFDYAGKAEGAAKSLLALLNDILDFSKIEAGKMVFDPRPFDLDAVLSNLSVILSANLGSKDLELVFDIDPATPRYLVGDDLRLHQILLNLGGNAIKFTHHGEVVVRVTPLSRTENSVELEFSVRDTGIGIALDDQPRIFTGFAQAEASTTRRFGGTGLGLAICHRLSQLLGGSLGLTSALGEGSDFIVTLTMPLADEAAAQALRRGMPERPTAAIERVLVIDDHAGTRDALARTARFFGWHADTAASGEEGLGRAQTQWTSGSAYDAVLVDWQMPGLDGWSTCRRLRALHGQGQQLTLILMVTAHAREAMAQRVEAAVGDDAGCVDGLLVKPISASMLLDAVVDARRTTVQPHPPAQRPFKGDALRLHGLRLLLAEDNANNQQIARELLGEEGAELTVVANGEEAVAAVAGADPPFDAVLMDLQMPTMDGYTAAGHIRNWLGETRLPIVAMTANAMDGDRQACLDAGMNAHVGKPFDLDPLVEVLLQVCGRAAGAAPARRSLATAAHRDAFQRAEQQGIELEAALARIGGNVGVYQRLLQSFIADVGPFKAELAGHIEHGRREDARRLVHTIKGIAGTLGARSLQACCAELELLLAGDAPLPHAAEWVCRVGAAADEAVQGLQRSGAGDLRPLAAPNAAS